MNVGFNKQAYEMFIALL